jgi:hypothetical protein
MNYLITKTKRNNLIICSIIIILNYFFIGFSFLFEDFRQLDVVENGIISVFFAGSYLYVFLVLIDYFKKYELRGLELIATILIVSESGNQTTRLINSFNPVIPQFISSAFSIAGVLCMIIWIIMILRLKSTDYSCLQSLRSFAFGFIAAFVLGFIVSIITMFGGFYKYYDLMFLPISIPFFFIIDFARKLELKEEATIKQDIFSERDLD